MCSLTPCTDAQCHGRTAGTPAATATLAAASQHYTGQPQCPGRVHRPCQAPPDKGVGCAGRVPDPRCVPPVSRITGGGWPRFGRLLAPSRVPDPRLLCNFSQADTAFGWPRPSLAGFWLKGGCQLQVFFLNCETQFTFF